MKRALGVLFVSLLCLVGAWSAPTAAQAGVDDFEYESWTAEYDIGVDDRGRAVARVTETIVPVFPEYDQNRGMVRGLPLKSFGAPTAPENVEIVDAAGDPVPFEVERDDGYAIILVGDDSYVHGRQTYVITYDLPDVIAPMDAERDGGTGVDEFYWDLVPIERAQPIGSFSARVAFSPELAERLTGALACYRGPYESRDRCTANESAGTVTVAPVPLPERHGVTLAVGLEPGSVQQPSERIPNALLDWGALVAGGAAAAAGVASTVVVGRMRSRRKSFRGTVVAQYDVPDHLPPLIAANIAGASASPISAELVHLAVRGVTRIEEQEGAPGLFGSKGGPELSFRLLDPALAPDDLDRHTVRALFPALAPNTVFTPPKKSEKFARSMQALTAEGKTAADKRGYFERAGSRTARILALVSLALLVPTAVLFAAGAGRESVAPPIALGVGLVAAVLAIIGLVPHRLHTPLGAETREYLLGVKLFIEVAEQERIRVLQSYEGAERSEDARVDPANPVSVVMLYERLLPYAMIFGLEKQWSGVLEVKYRESSVTTPYWYPALAAHGVGSLDRSLSQFTSSISSAASYSSSSSGGSSGGGFSGGGGGGGFAGGR